MGQTGAGKTHTMYGTKEQPGIAPRTITEIFRKIKEEEKRYQFTLSGIMVELYNNQVADLLDVREDKPVKEVKIRMDAKGVVTLENVTDRKVSSDADLTQLLEDGFAGRKVAQTAMNSASSRSHLIASVFIRSQNRESGAESFGKITLVDLAGSERIKKSDVSGQQQKEAIEINKSLSALGDVIEALTKGEKQVPYRNHKLTQLLQDALGGSAKTLMFVNVSPVSNNRDESIMSLKYAQRTKTITNKAAKRTSVTGEQKGNNQTNGHK